MLFLLITDHTFRPNFVSYRCAKNIHLIGKYSLSVANFIFSLIFRLIGGIKSQNGPVMPWIYHYQYFVVMNSYLCDLSFQEICRFRKLPGPCAQSTKHNILWSKIQWQSTVALAPITVVFSSQLSLKDRLWRESLNSDGNGEWL